jgi:tetratricopeptide (TPR) repeat protein
VRDGLEDGRVLTLSELGRGQREAGQLAEGLATLRQAVLLARRQMAAQPHGREHHSDLGQALNEYGLALGRANRPQEAELAFRESIRLRQWQIAAEGGQPRDRSLLGGVLNNLAILLLQRRRPGEARRLLERAVTEQKAALTDWPADPRAVRFLSNHYDHLRKAWESLGQPLRAAAVLAEGAAELAGRESVLGVHPGAARGAWESARARPGDWQAAWRAARLAAGCLDAVARDARLDERARVALAQRYGTLVRALVCLAERRCPNSASALNNLAWELATVAEKPARDPARAVALAQRGVALAPKDGGGWNTLGVAFCRAGRWQEATEALGRSVQLRQGGDAFDWFFLAEANHHLGKAREAKDWFDRAVRWTEAHRPRDEELKRFRTEAEAALGVR